MKEYAPIQAICYILQRFIAKAFENVLTISKVQEMVAVLQNSGLLS